MNSKKVIKANINSIKLAARSLLNGKTIIIPTDTVYGIAAVATSEIGVENIFKIKKRPKTYPLILFVRSINEAKKYAHLNDVEECLATHYWPGPLTLILRKKNRNIYNGDKRLSKIGIRIPKNKDVMNLLKIINKPLATTSANIHKEKNSNNINQLSLLDSDDVTYAISSRYRMSFAESTLVEVSKNKISLLRKGSITKKSIENILKKNLLLD
jgi:L-threonylcarbamoyladenylate synthase